MIFSGLVNLAFPRRNEMLEWIEPRPKLLMGTETAGIPKRVITLPIGKSELPIFGFAQRLFIQDLEIWHLMIRVNLAEDAASSLIAMMLLNEVQTILPTELMPFRPPMAFIRTDGAIRSTRGYLEKWVTHEVSRIAKVLRTEHANYVSEISAAVSEEKSRLFKPVPDGIGLLDLPPCARIGPPPKIPLNLSSSTKARIRVKPHESVHLKYRHNRYLQCLSEEELRRRADDILGNIYFIDRRGRISFNPEDPVLFYWMDRLTEVQVEMQFRYGPFPAGWNRRKVDIGKMPCSLKAVGPTSAFELEPTRTFREGSLVKYGKRCHLSSALHDGNLRIAPASLYKDSSLNSAIFDDELTADILYDPTVPFDDIPQGAALWPKVRVPFRATLKSNFYVLCLSDILASRLMVDFEGDACLVIHDPKGFANRVNDALMRILSEWRFEYQRVDYYDPLRVNPCEIDILWFKHFRYAYQREVRLAWIPPKPVTKLDPLFISVGNLEDIAELVLPT